MVGWSLDPKTGFPPSASGLRSEPRAVSSRRAVTPGGGPLLSWALCHPGLHTSHPGPKPSSLRLLRLPPAAGAPGRRRRPPRVFPMRSLPFYPAAPKCCREDGRPSWALSPHDLPAPLGASRVRITRMRPFPAREAGSTLRAPCRTSRLGWMASSADRVVPSGRDVATRASPFLWSASAPGALPLVAGTTVMLRLPGSVDPTSARPTFRPGARFPARGLPSIVRRRPGSEEPFLRRMIGWVAPYRSVWLPVFLAGRSLAGRRSDDRSTSAATRRVRWASVGPSLRSLLLAPFAPKSSRDLHRRP